MAVTTTTTGKGSKGSKGSKPATTTAPVDTAAIDSKAGSVPVAAPVATVPTPPPAPPVAVTPPAVTVPVPAPVAAPAVPAAAPQVARSWPANPTMPVPPAAAALLHTLYAYGATHAGAGVTKGRTMLASGVTHYGPTECRAAGLIDWSRGASGGGTRYLYLTPAGMAWVQANPCPTGVAVLPAAPVPPASMPPAGNPPVAG
jgi:hypothetical protein